MDLSLALAGFDHEQRNIELAWLSSSQLSKEHSAASELCCAFGTAGASLLNLLQDRRTRIQWLGAALNRAKEMGRQDTEAHALNQMGVAWFGLGDSDQARSLQQEALTIYRIIGDRHGEAAVLGNLANNAVRRTQPQDAVNNLREAMAIYQELGLDRGMANSHNSLAAAYKDLGELRRAHEHHRCALELFIRLGDQRGEAMTLNNLGIVLRKEGSLDDAVQHYERALALFRQVEDRGGEADALWNLSLTLKELGRLEQAIASAQAALRHRSAIEDPRTEKIRRRLREWSEPDVLTGGSIEEVP